MGVPCYPPSNTGGPHMAVGCWGAPTACGGCAALSPALEDWSPSPVYPPPRGPGTSGTAPQGAGGGLGWQQRASQWRERQGRGGLAPAAAPSRHCTTRSHKQMSAGHRRVTVGYTEQSEELKSYFHCTIKTCQGAGGGPGPRWRAPGLWGSGPSLRSLGGEIGAGLCPGRGLRPRSERPWSQAGPRDTQAGQNALCPAPA